MEAISFRDNLEHLVSRLLHTESHVDREVSQLHELHESRGFHALHGSENGVNPHEDANHNVSNWQMTMFSLSRELENICSHGSSPRDSPKNLSPCVTPTNGIPIKLDAASRRTVSLGSGHQGSLCESSDFPHPPGARHVRVRHEETEDRLDRSLTMICRQHSPQMSALSGDEADGIDGAEVEPRPRGSKLNYRDSAKYGIHFRLDLGERDPDDIAVSINTEEHILRVYCGGEVIHLLQLAENTDPQTLSCLIIDGVTLFIKRRSKETMCLEHEGSCEVSLPIVRADEPTLTTTVTLRVPPSVCADDVIVKTIDDNLMIRGGGVSNGGAGDGTTTPTATTKFSLAMKLPDGTESRSVSAWIEKSQLTVRAQLIPTGRRMTCAF